MRLVSKLAWGNYMPRVLNRFYYRIGDFTCDATADWNTVLYHVLAESEPTTPDEICARGWTSSSQTV